MSQTYNELLPTARDRARHALGLTNVTSAAAAIYSDEHIDAVLARAGSEAAGIAVLADALVQKYAQKPDSVRLTSGLTVSWKERIDAWRELAQRMRARTAAEAAAAQSAGPGSMSVRNEVVW
jgi:hypothetical protein